MLSISNHQQKANQDIMSYHLKHVRMVIIKKTTNKTAEAKRTTILQPMEQKTHSQKDRQNEKAEDYVPDERTR